MEENYLIDTVYNHSEIKAKISTLSAASHALFSLSELSLATLSAVINWMHEVRDRHGVFCVNHWSLWCKRGGSSWDDVYSWSLSASADDRAEIQRAHYTGWWSRATIKNGAKVERAHSSACITCNCTMLSTPNYEQKELSHHGLKRSVLKLMLKFMHEKSGSLSASALVGLIFGLTRYRN